MTRLAPLLLALVPATADANAACAGEMGWSPSDTIAPHGSVLFWVDRRATDAVWNPATPHATIDGADVPITATPFLSGPFRMLLVRVDSDKTGTLALTFDKGIPYVGKPNATFTVRKDAPGRIAKSATATVTHFHREIRHTTVEETYDGLALHVDVDALWLTVKYRRDADAAQQTIDVPIVTRAETALAAPGALLGRLGCVSTIEPAMLAAGLDVEVTAHLANGDTVPVAIDHLKL